MRELTARQVRALGAVLAGATSLREIAAAMGISYRAAADRLSSCRRKGYLTWEPGRARTLRLATPPIFVSRAGGPAELVGFARPGR